MNTWKNYFQNQTRFNPGPDMGTIYVKMWYISAGLRAYVGHNSPAFRNGSPFDSYNAQEYQNRSRVEFDGPISGVKFLKAYIITTDHLGSVVGVVDARGIFRSAQNDQGDCGLVREGVGIQRNGASSIPNSRVCSNLSPFDFSPPPVIGLSLILPISQNWPQAASRGGKRISVDYSLPLKISR